MLRSFTFVLLALPLAFGTFCPEGSVEYGEKHECIFAVDADSTYDSAQRTCRALGGYLIQPRDAFENAFANSQKMQYLGNRAAYIGVRRLNGVWRYADGTNLTYQHWIGGAPSDAEYDCGTIRDGQSYWSSRPCSDKLPFICSFSDRACPDGWHFYPTSGYCYYTPMDLAWTSKINITFDLGEYMCRLVSANLVSIHGELENEFVRNLTAKAIAGFPHECALSYYETVIGLNGSVWSDGSAFDYDLRRSNTSTTFGLVDPACHFSYWDHGSNDRAFASYMCRRYSGSFHDLSKKIAAIREAAKISRRTNEPFVPPEF